MVSDMSKWKLVTYVDTSEGDFDIKQLEREERKWRKEHKPVSKPRKKLTEEEKKQRRKEYWKKYYEEVLKTRKKVKKTLVNKE